MKGQQESLKYKIKLSTGARHNDKMEFGVEINQYLKCYQSAIDKNTINTYPNKPRFQTMSLTTGNHFVTSGTNHL